MRRALCIMLLPVMAVAVFSCARVERRVSVPVLHDASLHLRAVRVLVGVSTKNQPVDLSAPCAVEVWTPDDLNAIETVRLGKTPVSFSRGAVVLGGKLYSYPAVILKPERKDPNNDQSEPLGRISVGKTEYPGRIILAVRGESVALINYVSMEEYIAGVVSCELPSYFLPAALQAQAVAARTYALSQMKQNRLDLYDLRDDVSSQVYRGFTGTNKVGREAARRTSGAILVYDWHFLPAFYFSTCGGHTLPATQFRGAPMIPPLSGVECDYCRASPKYKWALTIPSAEISKALGQAGLLSGELQDIIVAKALPGGWVDTIEIVSDGARRPIAGHVLRQLVGTSRLYSTNFAVIKSGDNYLFEGRGFGHGVGMCQWGADGMARAGHDYVAILNHYYPGAGILRVY